LDAIVEQWVAQRPAAEVFAAFEAAEAAIAPVYRMGELLADPHVISRDVMIEIDGVRMQGATARLSRTPAIVRHAGRTLGADTEAVLAELNAENGSAR
jgi:crotonobetainyl-CoA:carnitine CoA-transferase CaiB-like acyl-CoA transferase